MAKLYYWFWAMDPTLLAALSQPDTPNTPGSDLLQIQTSVFQISSCVKTKSIVGAESGSIESDYNLCVLRPHQQLWVRTHCNKCSRLVFTEHKHSSRCWYWVLNHFQGRYFTGHKLANVQGWHKSCPKKLSQWQKFQVVAGFGLLASPHIYCSTNKQQMTKLFWSGFICFP